MTEELSEEDRLKDEHEARQSVLNRALSYVIEQNGGVMEFPVSMMSDMQGALSISVKPDGSTIKIASVDAEAVVAYKQSQNERKH